MTEAICAKYNVYPTGFIDPKGYEFNWDGILGELCDCLVNIPTGQFREQVRIIAAKTTDSLATKLCEFNSYDQATRVYSLMTFIVSKYVWCDPDEPVEVLPKTVGWLWWASANFIGIEPAMTHAALDLFNWKKKDQEQGFTLENIDVTHCCIYHNRGLLRSEKWFYIIHAAFELNSGPSIFDVLSCFDELIKFNTAHDNPDIVLHCLRNIEASIRTAVSIVSQMNRECETDAFYNVIRNYLSGTNKNTTTDDEGIPVAGLKLFNGSEYVIVSGVGGSAAQSSLVQVWDCLFDTKHVPHATEFFKEMRKYMPGAHRQFLIDLEKTKRSAVLLKEYVTKKGNPELTVSYNGCIREFCRFRTVHLGLISTYIVNHSSLMNTVNVRQGSGGTNPIQFAKGTLNATKALLLPGPLAKKPSLTVEDISDSASAATAADADAVTKESTASMQKMSLTQQLLRNKATKSWVYTLLVLCVAITVGWLLV